MSTRKPLTEEHKRKLSIALKGRIFSRETRNKIRNALLGRKLSEETKNKLRLFNIKNNIIPPNRKGSKHSDVQREKFRKAMLGHKVSNDTRRKISESQKGEKGSNWRGGITPLTKLARSNASYKLWRSAVFKRDNYTCVLCGGIGGKLNADHIKSFSKHKHLRYDVGNGRTLCIPCHRLTDNFGGRANVNT